MEDCDGENNAERREAHLANKQVHQITKAKIESAIEEQIKAITLNIEVLGQRDVEGEPMGPG